MGPTPERPTCWAVPAAAKWASTNTLLLAGALVTCDAARVQVPGSCMVEDTWAVLAGRCCCCCCCCCCGCTVLCSALLGKTGCRGRESEGGEGKCGEPAGASTALGTLAALPDCCGECGTQGRRLSEEGCNMRPDDRCALFPVVRALLPCSGSSGCGRSMLGGGEACCCS
eukprot:scaffold9331_cov19-Tisochrysis_lutea.AAC.1